MKNQENSLPIEAYRNEIVQTILENSVTIIRAETGAGKSTQVPQFLLFDTDHDIVVTQPRRLAASSVSARVAEELGEELGKTIGYRTAVERLDSPETRCLFVTDGLALVQELLGKNSGKILVVDEVHEWNENIEVLIAWVKGQIEGGSEIKVVLMSATLEVEKLSAFFNDAPVISVPGRMFPVEDQEPGLCPEADVADLVSKGRNVLVFQPGVEEITKMIQTLYEMNVQAVILPLHGKLSSEEQARCFMEYGKPKVVVSTNVAQTSVTIPDIDAVVDTGVERRIELVDGVEGLYLKPISLADSKQRKGRAGRVKPGVYIDHCAAIDRITFPIPEILRKRLDQTVLRLAIAGFDMEAMDFFHQPAKSDIHDARQSLLALGCMEVDGRITWNGRMVNKLPISVKYGRMLLEANKLGVLDDVLTVAAILEVGGLTVPVPSNNRPDRPDWRMMIPNERESDVLGQLAVWNLAKTMNAQQMKESGVLWRNFNRAKEIRNSLSVALRSHFNFTSDGNRENILKAVCAGMVDHLYRYSWGGYRNGDSVERKLDNGSVVRAGSDWVVGIPFDLEIPGRYGPMTINLVNMVSKIDPLWLAEIAPHLVSKKVEEPRWSSDKMSVVVPHIVMFGSQEISCEEKIAEYSQETLDIFLYSLTRFSFLRSDGVFSAIHSENNESLNAFREDSSLPEKWDFMSNREILLGVYTDALQKYRVISFGQLEDLIQKGEVDINDFKVQAFLSDSPVEEENNEDEDSVNTGGGTALADALRKAGFIK